MPNKTPMVSVLINTHLLMAARANGVERFFYSSSPSFPRISISRLPRLEKLPWPNFELLES
jgi:nucleoside-diphosphate-sugar epimerase